MKHIPIEFTFYAVEGVPLANAEFTIFAVKGGFTNSNAAVIVPGTETYITDELGKLVVNLLPSNQVYYLKVEESADNTELLYKFVVPETSTGTLRFQDLITETIDPGNLNDALVAQILGAKAETLAARDQAVAAVGSIDGQVAAAQAAATVATQSKNAAVVAKDAALVSQTAAKQSETLAKASELAAGVSKGNAATSEANALAYRNTANSHRLAAEASATLAGTHATAAQASVTAAQVQANAANTSAINAANSEEAVEADRAAVASMKASVEETNASSVLIKDEVQGLLDQALTIGSGWAPAIKVIADGAEREVLEIYDWIGGTGVKPAAGFVGSTGIVPTADEAINVKGTAGNDGSSFTVSEVGLFADRDDFDGMSAGFSYLATDTALLYIRIGPSGWSDGVPFGKGDKGDTGDRGATGSKGDTGERGPIGLTGPANNLTVGTVNTAPAGGVAAATITGTTPNQILNLTIPQGPKGDKGEKGEKGLDGIGAGDMLAAVYDPTNSGSVLHADAVPWEGIENLPTDIMHASVYDPTNTGVVVQAAYAIEAGEVAWTNVSYKPVVIAAGLTVSEAKSVIDLENVNNTSDADKPISSAQAAALLAKANVTDLANKVDVVPGMGLSTEDFTPTEKAKLATIATGATENFSNSTLLNRANHTGEQGIDTITNLQTILDVKQDVLVSGDNIKSINGQSIVGTGDLIIGSSSAAIGDLYFGTDMPTTGIWLPTDATYLQASYPSLFAKLGHQPNPANTVWSLRTVPSLTYSTSMAYGNNTFVMVGMKSSNSTIWTSADGIAWTDRGTFPVKAVAYGNNTFVAAGTSQIYTSTNGSSWTPRTVPTGSWNDITYGNGLFVAVGASNSGIITSPDGITWTQRLTGVELWSVAFGNGRFIALSQSGAGRQSTNGTTWSTIPTLTLGSKDVEYGDGKFVSVGLYGAGTTAVGSSWLMQDLPGVPQSGVTYDAIAYYPGRFIAGGVSPVGSKSSLAESPDAVNWTYLAFPSTGTVYTVNALNSLILVQMGTQLYTSPMYAHNTATQFYVPAQRNVVGVRSWIKAGD